MNISTNENTINISYIRMLIDNGILKLDNDSVDSDKVSLYKFMLSNYIRLPKFYMFSDGQIENHIGGLSILSLLESVDNLMLAQTPLENYKLLRLDLEYVKISDKTETLDLKTCIEMFKNI